MAAQQFEGARPKDPKFFPTAVWLQSPHNAQRYRDIGINLYVGLYGGPTEAQLEALEHAKMPVICHQNEVGLAHRGDTIVAWMHGDEPDNAQGRRLQGYAPPIPPHEVVKVFEAMKQRDQRPVLLNLGQGAAWDGWHGRGERSNHPEDYPEYLKGCDIVSFDIYPVTHSHRDVAGKLEFVGRGVQRLRKWSRQQKPVWACIETGHVNHAKIRPTPEQVHNEVWQAIACGADGIIYFAHEFQPKFVEAGLLAHDDVRREVALVNQSIAALAEVLNSEPLLSAVSIRGVADDAIAVRAHQREDGLYLILASLQASAIAAQVTVNAKELSAGQVHCLPGGSGKQDESTQALQPTQALKPTKALKDGSFELKLGPYGVACYRITKQ